MINTIEDVLQQAQSEGALDSVGSFHLSTRKALEKLALHLDESKHAFLLRFVQFCTSIEVSELEVQTSGHEVAFWVRRAAKKIDQLPLFLALKDPLAARDHAHQDLALSLNGAWIAEGLAPIFIDFGQDYSVFPQEDTWCLGECPHVPKEPLFGLILRHEDGRDWSKFVKSLKETYQQKCRFAPLTCTWDGKVVEALPRSRSYSTLEKVAATAMSRIRVAIASEGLLNQVVSELYALPTDAKGPNLVHVLVRGVERHCLTVEGPSNGAEAFRCADFESPLKECESPDLTLKDQWISAAQDSWNRQGRQVLTSPRRQETSTDDNVVDIKRSILSFLFFVSFLGILIVPGELDIKNFKADLGRAGQIESVLYTMGHSKTNKYDFMHQEMYLTVADPRLKDLKASEKREVARKVARAAQIHTFNTWSPKGYVVILKTHQDEYEKRHFVGKFEFSRDELSLDAE